MRGSSAILPWVGVALLSLTWLLGLDYYQDVNWLEPTPLRHEEPDALGLSYYPDVDWLPWVPVLVLGVGAMLAAPGRQISRGAAAVVLVLSLPAVWLAPWPYRAGVLLVVLCAVLSLLPAARGLRRLAGAALLSGTLLLAQGTAMLVYEALTAREHALPGPLAALLARLARLAGMDVARYQSTLNLFSMREIHQLAATWELLVDPFSLCFLVGGMLLVGWWVWVHPQAPERLRRLAGLVCALVVAMVLWLPVRAVLLMGLYLHDVLRTEYEAPLEAMRLFWSPWVLGAFLLPPLVLAWRLSRQPFALLAHSAAEAASQTAPATRPPALMRRLLAGALVIAAVAVLVVALVWNPVGVRAKGRVLVEEYHPVGREKIWEPTFNPFDTEWYGHLSGYNYYCIYEYCSRHYDVSRLEEPITEAALKQCDVLIIKVPTRRFSEAEIAAVQRFVWGGGGLLLIGEHTNVFGTGTYINALARRFGFEFRYDCLFGIPSVFKQKYYPPLVPHPVVQHMPPMHFAISCSIAPGRSVGRTVIRGTGLKNLMADYHVTNFYPQPDDKAEMHYGSFVQLWSTRYGAGRVLGFSDSTIFSNFATFEPGKPELMLGMIEWLNHRSRFRHHWLDEPRWVLVPVGLMLLLAGLLLAGGWGSAWPVLLACALAGFSGGVWGSRLAHRSAMPPPAPKQNAQLVRVVLDRTISGGRLPVNGFISGEKDGFGIFERWILRLGYFFTRRSEPTGLWQRARWWSDELAGGSRRPRLFDAADLVVFLYPRQEPDAELRSKLLAYVEQGGHVLVVDSPENYDSTANELLRPFGLQLRRGGKALSGRLLPDRQAGAEWAADWPAVEITAAAEIIRRPAEGVSAHVPLARLGDKVVAAQARYGRGTLTVVGFGSRFSDAQMGITGDVEPDERLRQVYELEFRLLRTIVGHEPRAGSSDRAVP